MEYSGDSGSLQSSADEEFDYSGPVNRSIHTTLRSTPTASVRRRSSTSSIHNNKSHLPSPPVLPSPVFDTLWVSPSDPKLLFGENFQHLQQQSHLQQSNSSAAPAIQLNTETPVVTAAVRSSATTRGSRKRPRASRRAPTTVLTTDTTNFRAMVQEFTGIPSPPFAAAPSLPFHRPRIDFFNSHVSSSSSLNSPPFLLRPFAQKFHQPFTTMNNTTARTTNSNSGNPSSSANSFQDLFALQSSSITAITAAAQKPSDTYSSIASLQAQPSELGNVVAANDTDDQGTEYSWRRVLEKPSGSGKDGNGTTTVTAPARKGSSSSNEGMLDSWICSSEF